MSNTLKIAAINIGLKGHGHNIAIPPSGIMTVVSGMSYFLPEPLKQCVEIKIFDQVLLGDQIIQELEIFKPSALLVSVQMSGYYHLALPVFEWAKNLSIPVLAGGQHFRVPDIKNGKQVLPGIIAKLAAEKRGIIVCYDEGEETAAAFIEHLFDKSKHPLNLMPNICYWNKTIGLTITKQTSIPIGSLNYPALSQSVINLRDYWGKLAGENLIKASGNDAIDGIPIGRTMFGPDAVRGCTYRKGRLLTDKENCRYCALTLECTQVSGKRFWELTRQMYDFVQSIPWDGPAGIRCSHSGDDMGSNFPFIKSVWKAKLEWTKNIPLGHRVYAWFVSESLARMLYDIGVRWLYIGADGKHEWTPNWSNNHPLVRTLQNCRNAGLKTHLGFVLGQREQSWDDIEQWNNFRKKLKAEFGDTIMATDGWVNVVVPGSLDWELIRQHNPKLTETDYPDLEAIRLIFWKNFTKLCENESPEKVKERLYAKSAEFGNGFGSVPKRNWMCKL